MELGLLFAAVACNTPAREPRALSTLNPATPVPRTSAQSPAPAPSARSLPLRLADQGLGEFVLEATATVELASAARIELQQPDGSWQALADLGHGTGYSLLGDCTAIAAKSAPCVSLAAGQLLRPLPFTGYTCAAQCTGNCTADSYHGGSARLVVSACDDHTPAAIGPSFELPPRAPMLPRLRAAARIVSATAQRVAGVASVTPGRRMAGYLVSREPARTLEPEVLAQLVKLLQAADGYDDSVVRRCSPGKSVGFLLQRAAGRTQDAKQATSFELVADFGCNKLSIGREQAVEVQASYFDGLRASFVGLVKQALPDDAELRALK